MTIPLPDVGLAAPLLARPVLRSVTREPAGTPLSLPSAIGVGRVGELGVDLAIGVGGAGAIDARFNEVARAASDPTTALEEALTRAGDNKAAAVMLDSKGRARALTHGVRS
jgi:hypothetical protein